MSNGIQIGDKVSVSVHGWFTRHYGVCVGFSRGEPVFIHNSYERGKVTRATLHEFARGRRVRVDQRAASSDTGRIVRRAESILGRKYRFLFFNCEHAANYACSGTSWSTQIAIGSVGVLGAVLAAPMLLAGAASRNRM